MIKNKFITGSNSNSKFKFKLGNRENGMENKIEKKQRTPWADCTQFRPNTAAAARPNLHAATMVPTGGPFGSVTRAGKLSPCHWRVGPARQGRFFPVNLARVALSSPMADLLAVEPAPPWTQSSRSYPSDLGASLGYKSGAVPPSDLNRMPVMAESLRGLGLPRLAGAVEFGRGLRRGVRDYLGAHE